MSQSQTQWSELPEFSNSVHPVIFPFVFCIHSGEQEIRFSINKSRMMIGSVISADIRIPGDGVSPIHAVLEVDPNSDPNAPQFKVYDLASETGLFLNKKRVYTASLREGDELDIGRHKLKLERDELGFTRILHLENPIETKELLNTPSDDYRPEEIFDYEPSKHLALEVIMAYKETIIDIQHFSMERAVTVGDSDENDFGLPAKMAAGMFDLMTRDKSLYILHPLKNMKGVIQRENKLESLEGLGPEIPIDLKSCAKLSMGDVSFYVSYTQAPPHLKRKRMLDKDPFFYRILGISLLFTVFSIVGIWRAKPVQEIELEELPERIATILYQPEKYQFKPKPRIFKKVEEQPKSEPKEPKEVKKVKIEIKPSNKPKKPVPKKMQVAKQKPVPKKGGRPQAEAKEGEGAKASGTAGTRGKKNLKDTGTHQTKAGTSVTPNKKNSGGGGRSATDELGNVSLLKSASKKLQDLAGNASNSAGKGSSNRSGYGAFDTGGSGGLALSGTGSGGGGTSTISQGLGNTGTGGGRVGTGQGAAGRGSGLVGGKTQVVLRGGDEDPVIFGSIDREAIEAAILAHKDEFRLCYEREVNANQPDLSGKITSSFTIGSSGRVTSAGVKQSSIKNANVEKCVVRVIKRIQFPIPQGAGIVEVTYPFTFRLPGN